MGRRHRRDSLARRRRAWGTRWRARRSDGGAAQPCGGASAIDRAGASRGWARAASAKGRTGSCDHGRSHPGVRRRDGAQPPQGEGGSDGFQARALSTPAGRRVPCSRAASTQGGRRGREAACARHRQLPAQARAGLRNRGTDLLQLSGIGARAAARSANRRLSFGDQPLARLIHATVGLLRRQTWRAAGLPGSQGPASTDRFPGEWLRKC